MGPLVQKRVPIHVQVYTCTHTQTRRVTVCLYTYQVMPCHICIYICIQYIYIYIHNIYLYIYICSPPLIYTRMYIHTHVSTYKNMCIYIYIYACLHIRACDPKVEDAWKRARLYADMIPTMTQGQRVRLVAMRGYCEVANITSGATIEFKDLHYMVSLVLGLSLSLLLSLSLSLSLALSFTLSVSLSVSLSLSLPAYVYIYICRLPCIYIYTHMSIYIVYKCHVMISLHNNPLNP